MAWLLEAASVIRSIIADQQHLSMTGTAYGPQLVNVCLDASN